MESFSFSFLLFFFLSKQSPFRILLQLDENIASNWDLYLIKILTLLLGMVIYLRRHAPETLPNQPPDDRQPVQQQPPPSPQQQQPQEQPVTPSSHTTSQSSSSSAGVGAPQSTQQSQQSADNTAPAGQ